MASADDIIDPKPDRSTIPVMAGTTYCAERGHDVSEVLAEIRRLGKLPGKVQAADYFLYRLFEPEFDANAREAFVGARAEPRLHSLTFDRSAHEVATDKCLFETTMREAGLPVPTTVCVFQKKAPDGPWDSVGDSSALAEWLAAKASYPVFGKPRTGIRSGGAMSIDAYDAASRKVELADGRSFDPTDVADALSRYRKKGYVIQTRLRPHADIAEVVGDRLATVRLVVLVRNGMPELYRAAWKLPAADNMADNFWRGNILAGLDPDDGSIVRAVQGSGLGLETVTEHPDSGVPLIGRAVPQWRQLVDATMEATKLAPGIDMQAWDVAVTDAGPVLVELNIGGDYNLPQLADNRGMLQPGFVEFLAEAAARRNKSGRFRKMGLASSNGASAS